MSSSISHCSIFQGECTKVLEATLQTSFRVRCVQKAFGFSGELHFHDFRLSDILVGLYWPEEPLWSPIRQS